MLFVFVLWSMPLVLWPVFFSKSTFWYAFVCACTHVCILYVNVPPINAQCHTFILALACIFIFLFCLCLWLCGYNDTVRVDTVTWIPSKWGKDGTSTVTYWNIGQVMLRSTSPHLHRRSGRACFIFLWLETHTYGFCASYPQCNSPFLYFPIS